MTNPIQPHDSPPRWLHKLLVWLHPEETLEEVEGDLDELYAYWYKRAGKRQATMRYLLNVVSVLPPFVRKRQRKKEYRTTSILQPTMIRNYLKIAFRTLTQNKSYATINVLGLALGMTCGIVIFTLVTYHLSFDNFHKNSDRTYRFVTEQHRETISYSAGVPSPLGKAFREDYTFSEKVARIATYTGVLLRVDDGKESKKFKEEQGVAFTEPEFFDIFNYPLLQGDKATVLREPNTAILTEQMARKYFGNANPINKTFQLDNKITFRITGVLKDLPTNTNRTTGIYVSYNTLKQYEDNVSDDSWGGIFSALQCFVQLRPGVSPQQVEKVLPAYVKKYRPTSKNVHHYKLQPLSEMHFDARYGGVMTKSGLWILSIIGLLLISTACINFINLATAQALSRSKEVGVRKVLGSVRGQLFLQFIAETGLITIAAVLLALVGSLTTLPYLNEWFHTYLTIIPLLNWQLPVFILLMTVGVTFFAGSYPGLILACFQPVLALKGKLSQQNVGGLNTRRTLIVVQFTISQLLIIGVVVIANQMRFAKQSDLGYNKEAIVMVPIAKESNIQTMKTLKERLTKLSGVKKISLCRTAPASSSNWTTSPRYDNRAEKEVFSISVRSGDEQYIPLFGLELVAGRNIYPSDTVREFVVNEMFAKKLNLTSSEALIGKNLSFNGDEFKGPIVGVVKDFHDRSLREDINPICITSLGRDYNHYAVEIDLATAPTTLAALNKTWSAMHPDRIFEYQFLDEQIAEFYQTESFMLKLIQLFTVVAIFIGCLGLYGLVSFMAARKTKEIGIRKVLGGSVGQILWIFTKEFSRLIIIAFVIATPIGWFTMKIWLKNYKNQVPLGIEVFAFAILGTFLLVFLTVGYRSVKAALANPVKSLRNE